MRALVTGGTGFLGGALIRALLTAGWSVRTLCRRPTPELSALAVEVVKADLRDRDAVVDSCRGIDVVHHTAAITGIAGIWRDFYETNVLGTQHVIAGCRQHGVRRLVYTSSPSITFDGRDQCGVDESAAYASSWLCHYPHSKALAEQAVLSASDYPSLATCALRPHLIWGPGDRHLIPRLLDRARRGQLRRVGHGRNRIDITYIDNAAAAHMQAAEALAAGPPVAGKAYFISQGEPVECWPWIDQILHLAGLPPVERSVPLGVAWAAGACLEGAWKLLQRTDEPRMTRFLALQLGRHHYFDISAARRDFGYHATIDTAAGMARLARVIGGVPA